MLTMRAVGGVLSAAIALSMTYGVASGQNYPNKPIRVLTTGVGGTADYSIRLLSPGLAEGLGQPLVIDNRVGNPGEIAGVAPPDGYTILVSSNAEWNALIIRNVNYDTLKEFSPIAFLTKYPAIVVVPPAVPARSIKELIALAKSQPGKLNYASSGVGTTSHLGTELFKKMAGVNIVHVPYKGGAAALVGLIGGETQVEFATAGAAVASLLKSGKLVAIAVTSAQPSALFPNLPTVAASGLPGYELLGFNSVLAPIKTPSAIINRLNQEFARVLSRADVKEAIFNTGAEASPTASPAEVAEAIKAENIKWRAVIKDIGIRNE